MVTELPRLGSFAKTHPRGCGARTGGDPMTVADDGSSPRARGQARSPAKRATPSRLIPAGAGPGARMRLPLITMFGSSPRVRGQAATPSDHAARTRLIPAGAGPGTTAAASAPCPAAHPRGCGARLFQVERFDDLTGSPPRVRGQAPCPIPQPDRARLIPAGAGPGWSLCVCGSVVSAHPRGCGARLVSEFDRQRAYGSSPRVRGQGQCENSFFPSWRLIPAGAGPGMYGLAMIFWMTGSSPRVRGQVAPSLFAKTSIRLIPAGAGPGFTPCSISLSNAAHPRGCGARFNTTILPMIVNGSSPRVRGQVDAAVAHADGARLIPAGAGPGAPSSFPASLPAAHPRGCGARR